jgi:hypothetical protein
LRYTVCQCSAVFSGLQTICADSPFSLAEACERL